MAMPFGSVATIERADLVLALRAGRYKIVKSRIPLRVVVIGEDGSLVQEADDGK